MSLAQVVVSTSKFDVMWDHLTGHSKKYRNMHLREKRQVNKQMELRYLHAMHANRGRRREIEGVISGPGCYWHYKLIDRGNRIALQLLKERAPLRARKLIAKGFLRQVIGRIQREQGPPPTVIQRTSGEYYLRRQRPGQASTHRHCLSAVASGVLDPGFVAKLQGWELALIRGQ